MEPSIVFDLDNSLFVDSKIDKGIVRTLDLLRERYNLVEIYVLTARSLKECEDVIEDLKKLKLKVNLFATYGVEKATIYATGKYYEEDTWETNKRFEENEAIQIEEMICAFALDYATSLYASADFGSEWSHGNVDEISDERLEYHFQNEHRNIAKVGVRVPKGLGQEAIDKCLNNLTTVLYDDRNHNNKYETNYDYIEITHQTKRKGFENDMGLNKETTIYVGDDIADKEVLDIVGKPILCYCTKFNQVEYFKDSKYPTVKRKSLPIEIFNSYLDILEK